MPGGNWTRLDERRKSKANKMTTKKKQLIEVQRYPKKSTVYLWTQLSFFLKDEGTKAVVAGVRVVGLA